jgi:biotin transport system substrate-specific component
MVLGNVVIYAFGIAGLMLTTGMPVGTAISKGLLPFLIGDAIKIALAAGLLPGTWKLLKSRDDA